MPPRCKQRIYALTFLKVQEMTAVMRSRLSLFCAACLVLAQSLAPLPAGAQQQQPTPVPSPVARPSGTGTLICSAAIGTSCGTTKADYVGPYKLNMSCASGFYDPIYGGTCWKCPADTDGKGGWIRSATAITKDDACWRIPKESTASATFVKKTALAWECPSGTFWDGYNWGGCWKCSDPHPRRTAAPVYAANACATPVNETRPAVFLTFNGCPKPDAETMKLKGKRSPGKPFLDIAGGWNQGVASGGCYACPVMDEEGNVLITQRNAAPIYGENKGCDILFKWKPGYFPEPGMIGLAGEREFILENRLFDPSVLTARLYFLAESRGLGKGAPQAKDWVIKQWQGIAGSPYRNEQFRAIVFANLADAAATEPAKRTPAQTTLIKAFEEYIRQRRTYIAQTGLDMYDAWKAHDDKAKQSVARSQLQVAFDYGTVPLDFHATLGAVTSLGATGAGLGGALAAAHAFRAQVELTEVADKAGKVVGHVASRETSLFGLSSNSKNVLAPLKLFKGTAAANAALGGATIIAVAFAVIQSVAMDQFIEIISARPKLEAALAAAQKPITVKEILAQPNGSDLLLYYWAKAMEAERGILEDPQVMAWAAAAHQQAQANGYKLAGQQ